MKRVHFGLNPEDFTKLAEIVSAPMRVLHVPNRHTRLRRGVLLNQYLDGNQLSRRGRKLMLRIGFKWTP